MNTVLSFLIAKINYSQRDDVLIEKGNRFSFLYTSLEYLICIISVEFLQFHSANLAGVKETWLCELCTLRWVLLWVSEGSLKCALVLVF